MTDVYLVEHREREHMQVTTTIVAACDSYATAQQHIRCNVAIFMADLPAYIDAEGRARCRAAYNDTYSIRTMALVRSGSPSYLTDAARPPPNFIDNRTDPVTPADILAGVKI